MANLDGLSPASAGKRKVGKTGESDTAAGGNFEAGASLVVCRGFGGAEGRGAAGRSCSHAMPGALSLRKSYGMMVGR